jgi:hypothetical protein
LPQGARRLRLDPARYRAFVIRRQTPVFVVGGVTLVVCGWIVGSSMNGTSLVTWLVIMVVWLVVVTVRILSLNRRSLRTYELLVGPRTFRRTVAGVPPAELLRPEVTGAFETPIGLWLTCTASPRSLFIVRPVEGYDDLRAMVATWLPGPIESLRGWTGWRRARAEMVRQGERDVVGGTILASDPSLAHELDELRRASDTSWMKYARLAPVQRRRLLRVMIVLWVGAFLLLAGMWLLTSQAPPPP